MFAGRCALAEEAARIGTLGEASSPRDMWMEAYGIALLALSLVFLLCLLSYDPNDIAAGGLAATTGQTFNLVGPVGAHLADISLSLLGGAVFLLVASFAGAGVSFLWSRALRIPMRAVWGYLLLVVSIASGLQLVRAGEPLLSHAPGGVVGEVIGEVLRSLFSTVGAGVILSAVLLVCLMLVLGISWSRALRAVVRGIQVAAQWMGARAGDQWGRFVLARQEAVELSERMEEARELARGEDSPSPWSFGEDVSMPEPEAPSVQWAFEDGRDDDLGVVGGDVPEPANVVTVEFSDDPSTISQEPPPDAEILVIEREVAGPPPERPTQTALQLGADGPFELPAISLLDYEKPEESLVDADQLRMQAKRLAEALSNYKIKGQVREIHPGPVVTMFEFKPEPGTRLSKIAGVAGELAMELKARAVRIVAPIPGKDVVGIEVPSARRETVFLKEVIADKAFADLMGKPALPLALGKDIFGKPVVADLAKMPHMLVAGTTGSGKSVAINSMIVSLLYRYSPEELKLILIDPKQLEFNIYEGIPHLMCPVVTDPKLAAGALRWAVEEMERRYAMLASTGVRTVADYNRRFAGTTPKGDPQGAPLPTLPYLVVILDEFADLMMVASKDVEHAVCRLAQKARAAGIHVILATQRPSTDVITGVIKANFPGRIGMTVQSTHDSRTIINQNGCEQLLGYGDMLVMGNGSNELQRVHGPLIEDQEIRRVVEHLKSQGTPDFDMDILSVPEEPTGGGDRDEEEYDPQWDDAIFLVAEARVASASMLQRRLRVGYNRASRMVDRMEREGIVGPADGSRPRQVLVPPPPQP